MQHFSHQFLVNLQFLFVLFHQLLFLIQLFFILKRKGFLAFCFCNLASLCLPEGDLCAYFIIKLWWPNALRVWDCPARAGGAAPCARSRGSAGALSLALLWEHTSAPAVGDPSTAPLDLPAEGGPSRHVLIRNCCLKPSKCPLRLLAFSLNPTQTPPSPASLSAAVAV